ncbi:MAG: trehalose-6-phosphate synthase [Candidatus Aminicenantes bacterium]|nr:trehalose-6-phosphate synthase [Candidatus Aminicenantes bacterium]
MAWTKDNLKEVVRDKIGDHKFIVISNREPYIHTYGKGGVECGRPASGMTTALDPVMRACGGTWIATGSGEADWDVVDAKGRVPVPPWNPSYTLRRVPLTREEEDGYYYGFANEALWPLCHNVYVRPTFRESDWEAYRSVNEKFADVVLDELEGDEGFVFIQDYHFALLPRLIKERRPEVVVVQFWHIPWPNPEAFRVCPQGEEILLGLLGNDILGFHIRNHGLNFLDCMERFMETRIDRERLSVVKGGRETLVRPFPISIDFEHIDALSRTPAAAEKAAAIRKDFRIRDRMLGVGVDRMDYTKGVLERFLAIDRLFRIHPEHVGRFVFVQLGPLTRIHIPQYKAYNDEIYHAMVDINERWRSKDWQPILLHKTHFGVEDVVGYFRAADLCVVSSLHDGMNLVAKEFVSARSDERGALVLSRFTGSARELEEAVLVNPIALDAFAEGLHRALTMDEAEQGERMRKMRAVVRENNVFRWAGKIVNEMRKLA